ncbi:MAG: GNAT family N-acetyltransferase [Kitasatospora sp.]|jgi:ribosomal protein S18 acetylase RimI-like enzyme|nr:GNAT family N-acetyltransferase [Kitasatospora sp.]
MADADATGAARAAGTDIGRLRSRPAQPEDYDAIAAVINQWWGRPVLASLPRLFLDHFHGTSLVVDGHDGPVAFLIGILSPAQPLHAYIHFVGVAPPARQAGLGRRLYEEFFALARADGRRVVSAVTAPANAGSIAFHRSMGFAVNGPVPDYNGPGRDFITFERPL